MNALAVGRITAGLARGIPFATIWLASALIVRLALVLTLAGQVRDLWMLNLGLRDGLRRRAGLFDVPA